METTTFEVGGMSCGGCVSNLTSALEAVEGVTSVEAEVGKAVVNHEGACSGKMGAAIEECGFTIGEPEFNWNDGDVWRTSAHNTKWCLIGCSIGEFLTLGAYSYYDIGSTITSTSSFYYLLLILPLINGLITSVMLETYIMHEGGMDWGNALSTALGMSFISMLMMEIAMEITDLLFTGGELGMNPIAIPFMLLVGFLTPWPYNYWRLKKYGKACH